MNITHTLKIKNPMSKVSVAILGINGTVGEPLIESIQSETFASKFQFPILAVTRDPSKYTSTDKIKYIEGDYVNHAALAEKLNGIDVIVELLHPDPVLFGKIEKLVAAVKPKLFIPSHYGMDLPKVNKIFPNFLGLKTAHSANVRALGIKVVDVYTSFFSERGWLEDIVRQVGIDTESKSVTYFSSPDAPFSYTAITDVGRTVAAVISLPISELPDELRVESGKLTPAEVVKRYEETHNVKLEVKGTVPRDEVIKKAKEEWAKGFDESKFFYYLQVVASLGEGYGANFPETDRELINPGESLWTWTKY